MDQQNKLNVPISILAAGVIIAGAIFLSNNKDRAPVAATAGKNAQIASGSDIKIDPVSENDHLLGSPAASVTIVEYSDLECPACRIFHPTLKRVMAEYGKNGSVAWVYRHFPLTAIHSRAPKEAEAAECASEIGGRQKFWNYIDRLFEITPSNNGLDPAELPKIAKFVGLDEKKFGACLDSGKYAEAVENSRLKAIETGAGGTPSNFFILRAALSEKQKNALAEATVGFRGNSGEPLVIVSNSDKIVSLPAAFPYDAVRKILDAILATP